MSEKIWLNNADECFKNTPGDDFVYIKEPLKFNSENIYDKVKLCIINTDFSQEEIPAIKSIVKRFPNSEIWASSNMATRNNIITANSLGIKNVVSSPFDKKLVEDFFINSSNFVSNSNQENKISYSSLEGLKVMIVDDNLMNVNLLEDILEDFDLKISSFLKPDEALKVIEHEKFDLFLLDIMMPEISGFDLAKKIKNIEYNKYSPIIFISALSDYQTQIKSYDLGSYAYIEKPFDINIVKSQIYNILKNKKMQEILTSNKESFLATVAHDLKTPISAEINALKLLLDDCFGGLEASQREILEDILSSTKFLQDLVENILCRNKVECDKIDLMKQVFSLKDIVKGCIGTAEYILKPKKQKIIFKSSPEEILLPVDVLEITRAVNNLLSNASQYSPEGKDVIVEVYSDNKMAGISVQDFGKGIDFEKQKDIFIQYMTYAKQYKRVGTGLGLYITKRIVEAHGGSVELESQIGHGTKISIKLPLYTKE